MNTEKKLDNYFESVFNIMKSCQKQTDLCLFQTGTDLDKFVPLIREIAEDYFKKWDTDEIMFDTLAYHSLSANAAILSKFLESSDAEAEGKELLENRIQLLLSAAETTRNLLAYKMEGRG